MEVAPLLTVLSLISCWSLRSEAVAIRNVGNTANITCGIDTGLDGVRPMGRIFGGSQIEEGSWPWLVAVMTESDGQYCGGTLISDLLVLTAAHCIRPNEKMVVFAGDRNLRQAFRTDHKNRRTVTEIFIHPKFNIGKLIEYDVGILKLDKPYDVYANPLEISTACLPKSNDPYPVETMAVKKSASGRPILYAAGWGKTSRKIPVIAEQVDIQIETQSECRETLLKYGYNGNEPESFICGWNAGDGKDTCRGDSGGPLMQKSEHGHWTVQAVVSAGIGCGKTNKGSFYASVQSAIPFILDVHRGRTKGLGQRPRMVLL